MSGEKRIGHCIICHADGVELTDEHVIPDAIGGYIHCHNVCKDCNSRMGDHVDNQLLNNFLIKGLRHTHKLKGKTNTIPNPLVGDGFLDTGEKVCVEDVKGVITPRILPTSPEITPDNKAGKITVDARDEKLIPAMQQKMLKKMGVNHSEVKLVSTRTVHQIVQPVVKMQAVVDLKNYKIALLKIAYEICVELFPDYENDPCGQKYADILYGAAHEREGALDRLDEVRFIGNGFEDPLKPLLSQFIDYENKSRHVIVVFNHVGHLSCLVKLFDTFSIIIEMSDSPYLDASDMMLYLNDFSKHGCEQMKLTELVAKLSEEQTRGFRFDSEGDALLNSLSEATPEVGFHANKYGDNLVFDKSGEAIMTEDMLKSSLIDDMITDSELSDSKFTTTYHIPEGLYFKVSPTDQLVQLMEIIETTEIHKY